MKLLMSFLRIIIVFMWIVTPTITIIHGIFGNLEQVENGLKVMNDMFGFEFMIITCLFGIYTVIEEKVN